MSSVLAIVAFVAALIGAILLHELGHLLTAKRVGMKADRYFVGFGPTLWSTRRGETQYGIKALPLGGFVSIRGMSPLDERSGPLLAVTLSRQALERAAERDDRVVTTFEDGSPALTEGALTVFSQLLAHRGTPDEVGDRIVRRVRETAGEVSSLEQLHLAVREILSTEVGQSERLGDLAWRLERGDEGRFYHDRPAWQRALAIFMGPATHLLIAFGLLFGLYSAMSLPTGELTNEVAVVLEDTPAESAGMEPGDRLVAVDGLVSDEYRELRERIRAHPGEEITLTVRRDGQEQAISLTPRVEEDPETGETYGLAGFAPVQVEDRLAPLPAARRAAIGDELDPLGGVVPMIGASVQGLVSIFSPSGLADLVSTSVGEQERDPEGVVSVIGIANLAGQTAGAGSAGVYTFFFLLAYLNVFLFIFNLVPLPPFDGGHLAVLGVEGIGNLVRRLRGRPQDFTVDPRAITAVALPVIGVLLLVVVTSLWLDISDPLQL
jgi:membrane-associated protease RseP (regulator of RpoE activity)